MNRLLNRLLSSMYANSERMNLDDIVRLLELDPDAKILDLGCHDGAWSREVGQTVSTADIYGLDIVGRALALAKGRVVKTVQSNLNGGLPFRGDSFDVVHANQVIEHLFDVDSFAAEINRILTPGGYAIISTENLSSWDNIMALATGRQAFSQHISSRFHVGNSLSLHHKERLFAPMTHIKIFTYLGLQEFFRVHEFKVEKILGAGYHPFPKRVSSVMSKLDPRHARFICIKVRKTCQGHQLTKVST